MESLYNINKITGEFIESETENNFILFLWPHIRKQTKITFCIGGASYFAWAIYSLIVMGNDFNVIIMSCAKIVTTVFFSIPLLFTRKSITQFTNQLKGWIVVSAVIASISEIIEYNISINAPEATVNVGIPFIIFFILYYYVLVPNKFWITVLTMWFISIVFIINIYYLSGPTPANSLIVFYFIMVNSIGYGILITTNKLTRNDYALRVQLESEVSQRKKAQELAEISSKAKSQFLAVMNHEIRTPLNIILGGAQILINKDIIDENKKIVLLIENSGNHLKGLIQNILDFTSLENNKLKIIEECFSLSQHLDDICLIYKKITYEKKLSFNYNIIDIPELIICDPIRLKQILINLLDNACKFCKTGSITLNVHRNKDNTLTFEVIDTGIGINKSNFKEIVKPFTQVEQSDTRRFSGSGLGLTICHELLNTMNSELSIRSEENKGSCFSFNLFLKEVSDQKSESEQPELNRYKILIVDDTEANLKITEELLRILNQDITCANSSKSAILKSTEDKFDILFIDFHMPDKNGIETALEIKKLNKDIKIFLMTADTRTEIITQCFESGFNDFISKPISLDQLKKSIRSIELKILRDELPTNIEIENTLTDKNFISQLKHDLGNNKFTEVIKSCISSLSEIEKLVNIIDNNKETSELLHRLKGLSGNYRLSDLYTFIKTCSIRDFTRKKPEIITLIRRSLTALHALIM